MREMKDSGIEWIGEIPSNWDIAPLKRFAKIQTGNTPSKTDEELFYADEGIPWIKPDNLGSGFPITNTTEYLTPEGCNVAKVMPPNTVYVCCIGNLGKVGYSQVKCCCNQQINALIFNDKMFWKFGYYLTLAQESRYWLYGNGNVLQIINSTNQGNIECVVPSIKEQKKISNFLDDMCLELDNMLTKTCDSIEEYKKLKQAVITQAVTKGVRGDREMKDSGIEWIGEIPADWEVVKMKNLGKCRNGLTYSPDNLVSKEEGTLVLRSSNIKDGKLSFVDNVYVNSEIKDDLMVKAGDILICSRNGSRALIGKNALIPEDLNASFGAFMMIFRCQAPKYVQMILNSAVFSYYLGTFLTSTINQLTADNFNNMKIVYCGDKLEQKEITEYLDKKCVEIDTLIAKKEQMIVELENYKKSVIYEYVTGKKEVPETWA